MFGKSKREQQLERENAELQRRVQSLYEWGTDLNNQVYTLDTGATNAALELWKFEGKSMTRKTIRKIIKIMLKFETKNSVMVSLVVPGSTLRFKTRKWGRDDCLIVVPIPADATEIEVISPKEVTSE